MWQFWLIVSGIFIIFEMVTTGFLVFWLGIGALLAMVTSFFTDNLVIQTAVFVISSTLLIFLTKPIIVKYFQDKKTVVTNAFSIIGKTGIVTSEINNIKGIGQIKVNGESWSAKSDDNSIIPVNTEVEILKIEGVKAIISASVKSQVV